MFTPSSIDSGQYSAHIEYSRERNMSFTRLGVLTAAALAFGLGGCASYGGFGTGYGYDDYGYGGYGGQSSYGYAPSAYYGWYDNYYYPGTGYYIYDRRGSRHRWNDRHRHYWEGRRDRNYSRGPSRKLERLSRPARPGLCRAWCLSPQAGRSAAGPDAGTAGGSCAARPATGTLSAAARAAGRTPAAAGGRGAGQSRRPQPFQR